MRPSFETYIAHVSRALLTPPSTQALQRVEWRWHAMIQFVMQLAAALACWNYAYSWLIIFWVSVVTKGIVVGVVSMQRLDDQRLVSIRRAEFHCEYSSII